MVRVELTQYGRELVGADVHDVEILDLDDLLDLLIPESSADGETAAIIDEDRITYGGKLVGLILD